jgi:hypothetical protein
MILDKNQSRSNKLIFIYTRRDCHQDSSGFYKPLQKIWKTFKKFRPNNTIMMDNTLGVMRYNIQNALLTPIYSQHNLKTDKYLPWLERKILNHLKPHQQSNIKTVHNKEKKLMNPLEFVQNFSIIFWNFI